MSRPKSKRLTEGRGADLVIVAASAPGIVEQAIALLAARSADPAFAQTSTTNGSKFPAPTSVSVSGFCSVLTALRSICRKNRRDLVFSGELPVEELISHRLPLDEIRSGFDLALHPDDEIVENNRSATEVVIVNNQMMAAVLYGKEHLQVEPVAVPTIESGDILVG